MNLNTQAAVATITEMTYPTLKATAKALGIVITRNTKKVELIEALTALVSTSEGYEALSALVGGYHPVNVLTPEQENDLMEELMLELNDKALDTELTGGVLTDNSVEVLDLIPTPTTEQENEYSNWWGIELDNAKGLADAGEVKEPKVKTAKVAKNVRPPYVTLIAGTITKDYEARGIKPDCLTSKKWGIILAKEAQLGYEEGVYVQYTVNQRTDTHYLVLSNGTEIATASTQEQASSILNAMYALKQA